MKAGIAGRAQAAVLQEMMGRVKAGQEQHENEIILCLLSWNKL